MLQIKIFFLLFIVAIQVQGQTTCTSPGQNPSTAFPVCGTNTFTQTTVPICGGRPMPFTGCSGDGLTDVNPFWYKFTCYKEGTLGFLITPKDLGDDYDWELYDITGQSPNDVYTISNLVVSNNWSGETGLTGASSAGTQTFICGGLGKALFSKMPELILGHDYLILISHFTQSQSGYTLAFGGGTAVITDDNLPALEKVDATCGGDVLRLNLNKKMKCSSITSNGSEFFITPTVANVTATTAFGCSTGFDSDSLLLQLSGFLPPGNYTLSIKNGNDGNTILDYCDRPIAETNALTFTVTPRVPTPMDSLAPLSCSPQQLRLVFEKPMLCSSIAANGSDFTINGDYPVAITNAIGSCANTPATSSEIIITLDAPLQRGGNFNLLLKQGTDGNTLFNECGEQTLAGSSVGFTIMDTVNADFNYTIGYGCTIDTIAYFHAGNNGVNSWRWELDEGRQSNNQNPLGLYSVFNEKTVQLSVSNGFCADTTQQKILLENFLKADFSVFEDNCPSEMIPFTNASQGQITGYSWAFGDGGISDSANPHHLYPPPNRERAYNVTLNVTDSFGCQSIAQKQVLIYSSCYLAVPNGFTPNADGKNDFFHPLNAIKAESLNFLVFNRWGSLVYKTNNWKKGWDGKVNGVPQATGTYVWLLRYNDRDTKKAVQQKGTVTLIR